MPGVFVFWGCSNKWTKRMWRQTIGTYFLTVMEAWSQKSRWQKSHAPFKGSREELFTPFYLLVFFGSIIPISTYVFKWPFFSVSLCPRSPLCYKDTTQIGFRVHLKLTKSAKILFLNSSTFTDSKMSGFI